MSLPIAPRAALGVAVGVALFATGCTAVRDHQGYVLDETLVAAIQPGVDNRDSVQGTLGRPTFVGQFDEKDWYYVSRETRQLAFKMPRPRQQTVLHVRFDDTGNVQRVERTGMELVANISPSGDETPTLGRNRGLFEELFGNIGALGQGQRQGTSTDNPQ
ncbi:MAG TPA: outer membrane protein assembly factor BamE [Allosphingosinicella sp.]|nr:outer membrane protein assembly factor BamE [Allosphingosinicella sp.]